MRSELDYRFGHDREIKGELVVFARGSEMHCDVNETTRERTLILNCIVTSVEENISYSLRISYSILYKVHKARKICGKSWGIFYTCVQEILKSWTNMSEIIANVDASKSNVIIQFSTNSSGFHQINLWLWLEDNIPIFFFVHGPHFKQLKLFVVLKILLQYKINDHFLPISVTYYHEWGNDRSQLFMITDLTP